LNAAIIICAGCFVPGRAIAGANLALTIRIAAADAGLAFPLNARAILTDQRVIAGVVNVVQPIPTDLVNTILAARITDRADLRSAGVIGANLAIVAGQNDPRPLNTTRLVGAVLANLISIGAGGGTSIDGSASVSGIGITAGSGEKNSTDKYGTKHQKLPFGDSSRKVAPLQRVDHPAPGALQTIWLGVYR
jgi:hypothetical protein